MKHHLKDKDTSILHFQTIIQGIWDNIKREYLQHVAHSLPDDEEKSQIRYQF